MATYDRFTWVDIATRGIVSPKERARARQELLDHIDDHTEALMSTGMPRNRAAEQACAAMGDPLAVGKQLRRVHQPVLSRLLRMMRTVLIILACLLALRMMRCLLQKEQPLPLWLCGEPAKAMGQAQHFRMPPDDDQQALLLARRVLKPKGSVRVGDYTLTVQKASVSNYETGYGVALVLDFTAHSLLQDSPVFTEDVLLQGADDQWNFYPGSYQQYRNLRHHYLFLYGEFAEEPEAVHLICSQADGGFVMDIDLGGGWDYEKGR